MPFTEKRLAGPTQLTTSAVAIYTVPVNMTTIVKQIVATNTSASAATFTLYIGTATAANAVFNATSVAANDSLVINLSQVLSTGEVLRALASANTAINLTISGVENDGPLTPSATYIADGAVTSAKIADGTIVNADINASAAIDKTKISGTAITAADTGTVTSTMILDGTIATADIANNAISQAKLSTDVPLSGMRNLLINGGMDVWQRGTAVKYNAGQGAYGPDRWCGSYQYQSSRTQQVSVSSAPSGLWAQYACRVSSPSTAEEGGAGSRLRLQQKVESVNSIPLRGRQVTLSFWIRFSAASFTATSGNYQDFVYNIGAYTSTTDSATNTTASDVGQTAYITNGSLPTTWTKYTLTYTVPTNANNVDAWFGFVGLGSHTTASFNWYEVTQVQLEVGSQPTQFEQRPIGVELALCQRYYWRTGGTPFAPIGIANTHSTTNGRVYIKLPVTMRRDPTGVTMIGSGAAVGTGTFTSLGHDRATTDALMANLVGTGFTAGGASMIYGSGDGTTYMEVTGAEL